MPLTPEQRAERLRIGRERVAAAGGRIGGRPPYGFLSAGQNFVPHPDEQPVAWLICHLGRQGWSLRRIAEQLEALGIPPRMGRHWSDGVIRGVLVRGLSDEERRTAPPRRPAVAGDQLVIRERAMS